ncbi:leucine-rich repeat receptor protein kinase HPCA1-like [Vicia villosa]|uniref:leucine-rich repeat receptor protein kinase HPCA1-like n=1 Tax=Vicia villosa TaxID=3911 RepID=UPI00273BB31D|nr:leucine-rich repeat receptor protein kinase HPCA1-like [Vicia villosa]
MEHHHKLFPLLVLLLFQVSIVASQTDSGDFTALSSLIQSWKNKPLSWVGSDPCGSDWDGIRCANSRITELKLPGLNLEGQLSSAIQSLSQLDTLDLSYNVGMTGSIPKEIGNLKNLKSLALVNCGFSGPIPDSIGSLKKLTFLALNSNKLNGNIPRTLGNLAVLDWLDLDDNQLEGSIPVSDDQGQPGFDMLLMTQHFHLGNNRLSGPIPSKLFNSSMILKHVLFDHNQLTGSIPSSLSSLSKVQVVRFDKNRLSGRVPSSLSQLETLSEIYLSHNELNGSLPDLTGMTSLTYVDLSDNNFVSSDIPSWVYASSLPDLTTVILKDNQLSGTLNLSTGYRRSLQLIDLQNNGVTELEMGSQKLNFDLRLAKNKICLENGVSNEVYCKAPQVIPSYSTPTNGCPTPSCSNNQVASPNCQCAFPYMGNLSSRAFSVSNYSNTSYYTEIEQSLLDTFRKQNVPVDSVSLSNPTKDTVTDNFQLTLNVFPSQADRFNTTGVSTAAFVLSNQIYEPPAFFSPYVFNGFSYSYYGGEPTGSKSSNTGAIIGAVVGILVFLVVAILIGLYIIRKKRTRSSELNPFVNWEQNKNSGAAPQLKGARWFSFDEMRKFTNNFAEANTIGSGGYGQVYQGALPTGELVAIKRAGKESMQGAVEFKTEIELLSRVHHKNLVSLVGFCYEKGEQMLVYEYVPNGTLMDSLTGKSGIWMDWIRRLKVTLGAARGLTYLHELADPPIIHRDIKSSNILLDNHLVAKVADFGLSKLLVDSDRGHVTTQVKGTMGYLDPEYYMTQQLTEKSDVYSFGVLMLELATSRKPIEQGKYIVREVMRVMDTSKDLYNLHSVLDQTILKGTRPKGLERYVELALRCVKEYAADRPSMAEVAKEIESIIELVGVNPNSESTSTTENYEEAGAGDGKHPYVNDDEFEYSGMFPTIRVDPQ